MLIQKNHKKTSYSLRQFTYIILYIIAGGRQYNIVVKYIQESIILIIMNLGQVEQIFKGKNIVTMIDLDITNYCFIDCTNFVEYKRFLISLISRTVKKKLVLK